MILGTIAISDDPCFAFSSEMLEKAGFFATMVFSFRENLTREEVTSMLPLVPAPCLSTPIAIIFPTFAITSGVVTIAERTT